MVQFHALALLYELKKNDRLALHKVVTTLSKNSLKNPMVLNRQFTSRIMLIRDVNGRKKIPHGMGIFKTRVPMGVEKE